MSGNGEKLSRQRQEQQRPSYQTILILCSYLPLPRVFPSHHLMEETVYPQKKQKLAFIRLQKENLPVENSV